MSSERIRGTSLGNACKQACGKGLTDHLIRTMTADGGREGRRWSESCVTEPATDEVHPYKGRKPE